MFATVSSTLCVLLLLLCPSKTVAGTQKGMALTRCASVHSLLSKNVRAPLPPALDADPLLGSACNRTHAKINMPPSTEPARWCEYAVCRRYACSSKVIKHRHCCCESPQDDEGVRMMVTDSVLSCVGISAPQDTPGAE